MPPRVRQRPLLERIKAYLDPLDFLLWLSEELETSDWEVWQQTWSVPLGFGVNLLMLVARANSRGRSSAHDDVFGDASAGAGFIGWLVCETCEHLSEKLTCTGKIGDLFPLASCIWERRLYIRAQAALPPL